VARHRRDGRTGDGPGQQRRHIPALKQPYSPADVPAAPQGLDVPNGYKNVDSVLTTVMAYNPTMVKQKGLTPPTSFDDLTKPQWKGQFSADARGVNWYESLIQSQGHDEAKTLITELGANAPRLTESHTLSLTQVQAGEPMATVAAYGYSTAASAKKTPGSVAIVNLTACNPAVWRPVWSTLAVSSAQFNQYSAELRRPSERTDAWPGVSLSTDIHWTNVWSTIKIRTGFRTMTRNV
jgi:ABC-type Fe3+ transport system substrate-binding protein